MSSSNVVTSGVLITSDEPTIVFIMALDEQASPKFIIRALDEKTVFVKSSSIPAINAALQKKLAETIFTEEDDSVVPASTTATTAT